MILKDATKETTDTLWNELTVDKNLKYGENSIFWIKVLYVNAVAIFVLLAIDCFLFKDSVEGAPPTTLEDLFYTVSIISVIAIVFTLPIQCFKFGKWAYHTLKFQRLFTETRFSPKVAACLCNLIFAKDLLIRQKQALESYNQEAVINPQSRSWKITLIIKFLTAGFTIAFCAVMVILAILQFFFAAILLFVLALLFCAVYLACSFKIMRAIMENERRLHSLLLDELLNRKVDEILAQRGNQ